MRPLNHIATHYPGCHTLYTSELHGLQPRRAHQHALLLLTDIFRELPGFLYTGCQITSSSGNLNANCRAIRLPEIVILLLPFSRFHVYYYRSSGGWLTGWTGQGPPNLMSSANLQPAKQLFRTNFDAGSGRKVPAKLGVKVKQNP